VRFFWLTMRSSGSESVYGRRRAHELEPVPRSARAGIVGEARERVVVEGLQLELEERIAFAMPTAARACDRRPARGLVLRVGREAEVRVEDRRRACSLQSPRRP
jgi:hypothetical protein